MLANILYYDTIETVEEETLKKRRLRNVYFIRSNHMTI